MAALCKYCHKVNTTWCCTSHTSLHEGEYFSTTQYISWIAGDFETKCARADNEGKVVGCSWFDTNPKGYESDIDAEEKAVRNERISDIRGGERNSRRTVDWEAMQEEIMKRRSAQRRNAELERENRELRRANSQMNVKLEQETEEKTNGIGEKIVKAVVDQAIDTVVPAPISGIAKEVVDSIIE